MFSVENVIICSTKLVAFETQTVAVSQAVLTSAVFASTSKFDNSRVVPLLCLCLLFSNTSKTHFLISGLWPTTCLLTRCVEYMRGFE